MFCCACNLVEQKVGEPDAVLQWTDTREVPAWLADRLNLYLAGKPTPRATDEPLKFYGIRESARLLETSGIKAGKLLGSYDALFICGNRSYPLWNWANLTAAWRITNDARLAGDKSFEIRAYKRKPKPQRTRREFYLLRRPQVSRVRFCAPRHVWADPKAVEACRVSEQERASVSSSARTT
jgi:hypothetical protein